ncbi:MAG: DUF2330 domain-containing protein [Actinomycetota bacterium]|nr:DUF2330 domain-containing protein [Actinomycetota bacterium]MDH5312241.1 DUF2330 domain-containing protein [Actinomycetota bacterium]
MGTARRMLRPSSLLVLTIAVVVIGPVGAALACGGLVTPNGTINLLRTTTLAAYHGGVEHYVTSFEYVGQGQEIGSIVPLPGVPTKVVKGGDWTLQRLQIETQPPILAEASADSAGASARVLLETEIDSLDITVLEGGAVAVGTWARDHDFFLPPDAPEVLEFYADRSPIFLAARFDAERAARQGLQQGQGTPIHVVIPTPRPWVPLRILALGRQGAEVVEADVFLLTDEAPALLPQTVTPDGNADQRGLILETSEPASHSLMRDLRSDSRMGWLPEDDMWLTYVRVNERADRLGHDLAVDASGFGRPDPVAAGFSRPTVPSTPGPLPWVAIAAVVAGGAFLLLAARALRPREAPTA